MHRRRHQSDIYGRKWKNEETKCLPIASMTCMQNLVTIHPLIFTLELSTNTKITQLVLARKQIGNRKKQQVTRLQIILATSTENFMKIRPAISEERLTNRVV